MAGNGSRAGSSRSSGGSPAAAAPARRLNEKMISQGKKTGYKAGNLLDNAHQDNATARAIRRVGIDRRMGLQERMLQRQLSRQKVLSAAQDTIERSNLARAYRSLRSTPAPVGGPKVAREYFKIRGRSRIPRAAR